MDKVIRKYSCFVFVLFTLVILISLSACKKKTLPEIDIKYTYQEYIELDKIIEDYNLKSGVSAITNFEITSESSIGEVKDNKLHLKDIGEIILNVKSDKKEGKIKLIIEPEMIVKGSTSIKEGGANSVSVKFNPESSSEEFTITSSDESIASVYSTNKIKGVKPGKVTITVKSVSGLTYSYELTVGEATYKISFNISDEYEEYVIGDLPSEYSSSILPLELPKIERAGYAFYGWQINPIGDFYVEEDLVFDLTDGMTGNITLKPIVKKSFLELRYETTSVVEPDDTMQLVHEFYDVPDRLKNVVWESLNPEIATVDQNGLVTGVSDGLAEISAYLKDMPDVNMKILVSVQTGVNKMSELMEYIKSIAINETVTKPIVVSAYQGDYKTYMYSGVTYYLFEKLNIIEQMTPEGMSNRPGVIYEKKYITVHDTASGAASATGKAHANYVNGGGEGTSWHYTVANDGIYHQIPDNENAYHAGDGGRDYLEIDTGIKADPNNPRPVVTISEDGYYEIAGQKTKLLAPVARPKKCTKVGCNRETKEGETACSNCGTPYPIATNAQINSHGIRTGILDNGNYYIGNTYYNNSYGYISNAGGNDNGIGIEMCVNQGSDIFYTWQRNAKLVAKLMLENNLTIHDVKPHHFFSGKDCPATMLHAEMWDMFIEMVEVEYTMLTKYSDYEITFESHSDFLDDNGKVIKQASISRTVSYTITIKKDGVSESITLCSVIPGTQVPKK